MTRVIIPGVTHMAIINGGDGSAWAQFFSSETLATEFMEEDEERFCDDVLNVSEGVDVDTTRFEWDAFRDKVHAATHNHESELPDRVLAIAEYFECAEGAVRQWAQGQIRPCRSLRDQVIGFVFRRQWA